MNDIGLWIVVGVLALIIICFIIVKAVELFKISPEERKKVLVTYLKGLVALAELEIGGGHGQEKLAMVEMWFKKKAPFIFKMCLLLFGKDSLKELIELALAEIKESFER